MKRPFTRIAAVIFGIGALVHLLRLIFHFSVNIGRFQVPLWASVIGLLVAGLLAVMLWREASE
jgi:protein-S-isoprenylcysteine O-methyltransferase Ste14